VLTVFGIKLDGEWVDIVTLSIGAVWAARRVVRRRAEARKVLQESGPWLDLRTSMDYAVGSSLLPYALLALCPLSSDFLALLIEGQRMVLSVAGFIALGAVMGNA
jgi:hypothetical protein